MMKKIFSNREKIGINKKDLKILLNILEQYPCEFYAYGSRVKGYARRFSDLDLFYDSKASVDLIYEIKEELDNSNISIKVSLLSRESMSNNFYDSIKKDLLRIR